MNQFKAISLSARRAGVEWRERFHFTNAQARDALLHVQEVTGLNEMMLVSTCNRTELYWTGDSAHADTLIQCLAAEKGLLASEEILSLFDRIFDHDSAVLHLFEVSNGLQSNVLGDLQISHQVKEAYAISHEIKLAGPFIHRLMHTVFHSHKRVQQETSFRDGAASVSYAAAQLVHDLQMHFTQPSVLVIGAGEMAADVVRNLHALDVTRITILNRTLARAEALAAEVGATVLPLDALSAVAGNFEIIVTALTTEHPVLTPELMASASSRKYTFVLDISVPRAADPAIDDLPGVHLYDVDDINVKTDEVLKNREAAVEDVQRIIREEMAGFIQWTRETSLSPVIQKMKESLEQIRQEEMTRFVKGLDAKEAELADRITKSLLNKIIHLPVMQLKEACRRGDADQLVDVLNDLFDLEKSRTRQG